MYSRIFFKGISMRQRNTLRYSLIDCKNIIQTTGRFCETRSNENETYKQSEKNLIKKKIFKSKYYRDSTKVFSLIGAALAFIFPGLTSIYADDRISENKVNRKKIFISYQRSSSKHIVSGIVKRLRQEDVEVWFDDDEIKVADDISVEIQKGILSSSIVLCFISKEYLKSKMCRKEFFYSHIKEKNCVYLVLEELDSKDINGIEMFIKGDQKRLDIHKLQKSAGVDKELIENIYKELSPIIKTPIDSLNEKENIEIIHNLKRDENFIGRDDVFTKIDEFLSSNNKSVLLYGMPGVGKTSCAIEYILKAKEKDKFDKYFTFQSDENYKIRNSISLYCKELNLIKQKEDFETELKKFINYLNETNERIVLLFDNVENFEDFNKLIDYKSINKPIIVTSKSIRQKEKMNSVEILPFSINESKKYLKKKLPHISGEDLIRLFDHIKDIKNETCLAYKLTLLAGFLSNNPTITIEELTKNSFNDNYLQQLIKKVENKSKDAIELLKYLCLLDPDYIPKVILKELKLNSRLNESLQIIFDYNLCKIINPNSPKFGISIHRLLKDDIENNCFKNNEEKILFRKEILDLLSNLFPCVDNNNTQEWENAKDIYNHAKIILEKNAEKISIPLAFLHEKVGTYEKFVRSDLNASLKHHKISLNIYNQLNHDDQEYTARSMNNIGLTYKLMGDNKKALEYYNNSLAVMKCIYKDDHGDIATYLNNIGSTYDSMGDFTKALEYYNNLLAMMKRIYKDDHGDIATSLNNIGLTYKSMGHYQKALEYFKISLAMMKRIYKDDHGEIATSLNNIGSTYYSMGHYQKALGYFKISLEMRERIYKDDHVNIATSLNNIGSTYYSMGDFTKAFEYHNNSIEMRKRIDKDDHVDIATYLNNIGSTYESMGDFTKALEYYNNSLEMLKRIYKDDHVDIATSMINIGFLYKSIGKVELAEAILLDAQKMGIRLSTLE